MSCIILDVVLIGRRGVGVSEACSSPCRSLMVEPVMAARVCVSVEPCVTSVVRQCGRNHMCALVLCFADDSVLRSGDVRLLHTRPLFSSRMSGRIHPRACITMLRADRSRTTLSSETPILPARACRARARIHSASQCVVWGEAWRGRACMARVAQLVAPTLVAPTK